MDQPRGTSRGWKTKPPQLQGLSQCMSSRALWSLRARPCCPPQIWIPGRKRRYGGRSFMEGRCESSCGARGESQRDPLDTARVGSAPSTRKAMLGVKSVTNRSCSEVPSEPSLPKDQGKTKVLTNQGKSQTPVPAGATAVPKLPPSTRRPLG